MNDLENRVWLCKQVMEVLAEHGMSTERALAMLHVLTDRKSHEPYLSDQGVRERPISDFWEPRKSDTYRQSIVWPPVNEPTDLDRDFFLNPPEGVTSHEITLGPLNDQPDYPEMPAPGGLSSRRCALDGCRKHLRRKPGRTPAEFREQETCDKSCATKLRWQRRRDAELGRDTELVGELA